MAGPRVSGPLFVLAWAVMLPACAQRPLGVQARDASAGDLGNPGQGGRSEGGSGGGSEGGRSGCGVDPRVELVGSPLLVLDHPPTTGNLYPALVWTGQEYLFVWRVFAGDGVFMKRIDPSGESVSEQVTLREPYENAFDFAWGGSRLAAVWTRALSSGAVQLLFQTFDRNGRPISKEVVLPQGPIAVDGGNASGPRSVPTKDGFALVWRQGRILVTTVDGDGQQKNGPVVAGGAALRSSLRVNLAAGADRLVIGWNGSVPVPRPSSVGPSHLTAARGFSGGLVPLGDVNTLDAAAFNTTPQILATGGGFLVLWTHGIPSDFSVPVEDTEVRIAQFDGAGSFVAAGRMDPPAGGPFPEFEPFIWNRDHVVVVWPGKTGLTLSRHAPTGGRQGEPLPLATSTQPSRVRVTAHDGTVGFIWSENVDRGYRTYFQQARSCP